ncbi:protein kinase domain-containing protein [Sorangium cellulosum]|uniref:Protein kinase n=1 Tax=Sorangium cellulosum TaxID=56 RepID=A0A150Q9T8_SORCE|nr:protein kinase [Sorangium cellulosum]KYF64744.1 protein kinase [Sorangium cellulosum]
MPYPAPEGTELIEHLGAGATFDVALVRLRDAPRRPTHGATRDSTLVCKRLAPGALHAHAGRAAMVREAKALALARHPALPALARVGADRHGPFLLETRREGASLRDVRDGWRVRGRPPPASLVVHVVRTAIETLAELQELEDAGGPIRFAHGDIGPDHVLLGPLGDIGLVDLGAARFRGMEPELETADRGTAPFVAPEIARGESPPTPAGDVYALAATLVAFATGAPLTRARDQAAVLVEISESGLCLDALAAADALAPGQRRALARELDRDPARRAGSARSLLDAFDAAAPRGEDGPDVARAHVPLAAKPVDASGA